MKNNKQALISGACALALAANSFLSAGVFAQDKPQERQVEKTNRQVERTVIVEQSGEGAEKFNIRIAGPPDGIPRISGPAFSFMASPGQGGDHTFQFVSTEMTFENKVVKGAPFSGEMVYESVQTLADGNRIVNRSATPIYRDSQGRTRREQSFTFFGPLGGGNNERRAIQIFDPVSNTSYTLDPQSRTAQKMTTFMRVSAAPAAAPSQNGDAAPRQINVSGGVLAGSAINRVQPSYPPIAKAARAQGAVQVQITVNEGGDVAAAEVISGHPLLRDSALDAARQWQFKPTMLENRPVKVKGILTFNFTLGKESEEQANAPSGDMLTRTKIETRTEQLGKQNFEGVEVEGTRKIETLPAGAIGNERPIEIIHERWYSPELQMVILTRYIDPRLGETTQRLINVIRSEPDASYFQVPSDYTVKEGDNIRLMEKKMKMDELPMRKPNNQ